MSSIATRGLLVTGILGIILAIVTWHWNPGTGLLASAAAFGVVAWLESGSSEA